MVEVAVILTISTVVLLLLLIPVTRWIVPLSLEMEEHEEELPDTKDDQHSA